MKPKLIFFDIDGTIVTENGGKRVIPQSTKDTIHDLQQNGHLCFINTGRTLSEIDKTIHELCMDGFVCGCGTYIIYHDNVIFEKTIPFSLGNRILKELEQCNLEWLLEGSHTLYYSTRPYHSHIGDFQEEHRTVFSVAFDLVAPENACNLKFDKFCICTDETSNLLRFQNAFKDELTFIDRGSGFYEVVPSGCSKASGIQYLMDYFHIPLEDTIAIGDSTNDLPMLEFAETSIAMGGSCPQVCEAADMVTDDILQDGLQHAFHKLGLV
ncbi:MAG: HAD family phosphatase [Lachnospiraceae bacterium]|nr:HAD family phosphatase [Lachnospiraceae bacterium]